jgi:hypothetical protein
VQPLSIQRVGSLDSHILADTAESRDGNDSDSESGSGACSRRGKPKNTKESAGLAALPPIIQEHYDAICSTVIEWTGTLDQPWKLDAPGTETSYSFDELLEVVVKQVCGANEAAFSSISLKQDSPTYRHASLLFNLSVAMLISTQLKQVVYDFRRKLLRYAEAQVLDQIRKHFELEDVKSAKAKTDLEDRISKEAIKEHVLKILDKKSWFFKQLNDEERANSENGVRLFGSTTSLY